MEVSAQVLPGTHTISLFFSIGQVRLGKHSFLPGQIFKPAFSQKSGEGCSEVSGQPIAPTGQHTPETEQILPSGQVLAFGTQEVMCNTSGASFVNDSCPAVTAGLWLGCGIVCERLRTPIMTIAITTPAIAAHPTRLLRVTRSNMITQ